jgi:hypothetical protein
MPNPNRDPETGRFISIGVSTEEAERDIAAVNDQIKQTSEDWEKTKEKVDEEMRESYRKTISLARNAYTIGLGLVKSTGASVSYFFRSMISAAFGAIAILEPLLTAKSLATYDYVSMAIGMAELGVAIAAVIAAEAEQSKIARGFRGAAMSLGGLSQMLNMIPHRK